MTQEEEEEEEEEEEKKSYENSTRSLTMNKVLQLTAIISESVQGRVSPPPKRLLILSRKDPPIAPHTKPQLEHQNESQKEKKKDGKKSKQRKRKKKMKSANEIEVEQFLKSKAVSDR
jgi:hypothetical protein